jgi:hypothetical protein
MAWMMNLLQNREVSPSLSFQSQQVGLTYVTQGVSGDARHAETMQYK